MVNTRHLKEAFEGAYSDGRWGVGFGSGHGSRPRATRESRIFLEDFVRANRVRRIVDYGCGDWQIARLIDWQGASYFSLDVVPALIERNMREFGKTGVEFIVIPDDPADLPQADLLLCKDVLQHLPVADVEEILRSVVPRFPMALVTNDAPTTRANLDIDIPAGQWRPVEVRDPLFAAPAVVIRELRMLPARSRRWRHRGQFNAGTKPIMLLRRDRVVGHEAAAREH
jgi:SAM-dependent methyltransferase